jgi:hypothetical protein
LLVSTDAIAVGGLVVIPEGTTVSYSIRRKAARRMLRHGRVELRVEGIYTVFGEQVLPLDGDVALDGERPFVRGEFAPLLLGFIRGGTPVLPAGTIVDARVLRTITFTRDDVERLTAALPHQAVTRPRTVLP